MHYSAGDTSAFVMAIRHMCYKDWAKSFNVIAATAFPSLKLGICSCWIRASLISEWEPVGQGL